MDGIEDIAHELYKRLEEFKMQSPSFAMVWGSLAFLSETCSSLSFSFLQDEIEKRKSQLIILDRYIKSVCVY